MTTNDGGPAFPTTVTEWTGAENRTFTITGMSLRDWFAGQALVGLLQRGTIDDMSLLSEKAWHVADFMLVERAVVR